MVFFVCDGCQESLKKPMVEKHSYKCPYFSSVTCVDCSKTFHDLPSFNAHNTCISEAEKYEKSLFKPKGKAAKRDPQAEWLELIQIAASSNGKFKSHLERIQSYTNVPRKPKPFAQFCHNSVKIHDEKIISEMFTFIYSFQQKQEDPTPKKSEKSVEPVVDVEVDDEKTEKLSKKRKLEESEDSRSGKKESSSDFSMKEAILSVLKEKDGEISLKKLKKKAVAAGENFMTSAEAKASYAEAYEKLLKKGKIAVRVDDDKDIVSLL